MPERAVELGPFSMHGHHEDEFVAGDPPETDYLLTYPAIKGYTDTTLNGVNLRKGEVEVTGKNLHLNFTPEIGDVIQCHYAY
jgi:hypothetical protein